MTFALLQAVGFGLGALLATIVDYAYYILFVFIIAWVLIGWFPNYPSNGLLQAVYDVVGRVVDPIPDPTPHKERTPAPEPRWNGARPLPDSRHLRPLDSPKATALHHRRLHRPDHRLEGPHKNGGSKCQHKTTKTSRKKLRISWEHTWPAFGKTNS